MKDIKTKNTAKKDIKVLDKAGNLAKAVRNTAVRTKDNTENFSDDGQITPEEYANDKIRYMAKDAAEDSGRLAGKGAKKTYKGGKKLYKDIRRKRQERKAIEEPIKQTAKSTGKQTAKTVERSVKIQQRNIKTAKQTTRKAVKTSKETARAAVKTAEKTAKASAKASKLAVKTAKETAIAVKNGVVVTAKATVAAIKAAIAGIKGLIAAIAAGGWVAVVIIIVICFIGLIAGSCFGIFLSGEDTGNGMSIKTVITEINDEYQAKINDIKTKNPHDVLEMTGSKAVWPEVLSVYAVRTASDPDNPQEVASMNESKKSILKNIFWEMNVITSSVASKTEEVSTEKDDGKGNIIVTKESKTRTYLYITISHKTTDEMATKYSFNTNQKGQLTELLSDEYRKIWSQVLSGYSVGSNDIVAMAVSQIGNVGGQPFWSWYGFGSRVEWCGCFVSWCANQCGYIESGVIPKYALCSDGVQWFKNRNQWQDRSYIPKQGDIIFFDWASNGSDGLPDHTGIVEKVENNIVYTIEGNTTDSCNRRSYSVTEMQILGYGVPKY